MPRDCPACGIVNTDSATICDCGYNFDQPEPVDGAGPQPPSILLGLLCLGFLLFGVGIFWLSVFSSKTPENELTLAEGVPSEVSVTHLNLGRKHSTDVLHFSVGGYRTEYGSKSPKFQEVLEAVRREDPIQIWVSTKQETLFARSGWVPLYKMSVQGKLVLTYSDVMEKDSEGSLSSWICGGFILALGLYAGFLWYRARRRYTAWVRLEEGTRTRVGDTLAPENGSPSE